MDKTLFLIDGHSLIFRMYYAFLRHPMVNSKGEDVSILYGFVKYLFELIEKYRPSHLAVCFDPPGKTFRHEMFPEYKGTRQAAPELVISALEPLKELCEALDIPVLMVPGFEGDDVLGSMAVRSAAEGMKVYMVTPDKDFGQLVSDSIFQLKPGKSGAEDETFGPKELCEKLGLDSPQQVVDMLTICGDSADNVPGVNGVGEKGASKLLLQFGTVENIYAHLGELTPRQAELFRQAQPHIALSKTLVTIRTDVAPAEVTAEDMMIAPVHRVEAARLFEKYEFPSLKKYLHLAAGEQVSQAEPETELEWREVTPAMVMDAAREKGICAVWAVDAQSEMGETLVAVAAGKLASQAPAGAFDAIFRDPAVVKAGFGLKQLAHRLALLRTPGNPSGSDQPGTLGTPGNPSGSNQPGTLGTPGTPGTPGNPSGSADALAGKWDDIELMHYLVDPERSHKPEVLSRAYLGLNLVTEQQANAAPADLFAAQSEQAAPADLFAAQSGQAAPADLFAAQSGQAAPADLFAAQSEQAAPAPNHCREAVITLLLHDQVLSDLKRLCLERLFDEVEEPLQKVLARMEDTGVKVELGPLREFAAMLEGDMRDIEARVREMAGMPDLNISSPLQVGEALFVKLRIDPRIKPKKDSRYPYPTDEETLMNYADANPIIGEILEYRAVKKLLSTYIEPLGGWISPRDGRIHTTFNQALTATGRLSSSRPNLQNIPVRTERGRVIRKAFVSPSPDWAIVSADYSQIELRLMAHFCGDANMLEAFRQGVDVHTMTAARIAGVSEDEVTPQMRRAAKTANFGIIYGISAFGLAQRLRIPRVAAKKLIEDYFAGFPAIVEWIAKAKAEASQCGYAQTLFGRRRYLPDINSRNATVRALAERNAVNAPIQGTAADIIKIAMVRVDERLRKEGLRSRMVLQIHDELVFEALLEEVEQLRTIIKEEMENVISLNVPLTVECNYGNNWLEAH